MLGIPVAKLAVIGGVGVIAALYLITGGRGAHAEPDQSQCQFQVSADSLNVRSAPSVDAVVVGHYQEGASVTADPTTQGDFRKIDDTHWVSGAYLTAVAGNTC